MAAEEADNQNMKYDELKKIAKNTMIASKPRGNEKTEDENGKAEEEGKAVFKRKTLIKWMPVYCDRVGIG